MFLALDFFLHFLEFFSVFHFLYLISELTRLKGYAELTFFQFTIKVSQI